MTANPHTIRFRKNGTWRCSCGSFGTPHHAAENHAWDTAGSIELAGSVAR